MAGRANYIVNKEVVAKDMVLLVLVTINSSNHADMRVVCRNSRAEGSSSRNMRGYRRGQWHFGCFYGAFFDQKVDLGEWIVETSKDLMAQMNGESSIDVDLVEHLLNTTIEDPDVVALIEACVSDKEVDSIIT
ncbi:hypothetical protein V6N13_104269 [Hibiscus sabdariffa]